MEPMFGDLKSKRLIVLKAVLFVGIGILSGLLLWAERPEWRTVVLLTVCVWAFCRAYYFAFYVITNYLDPEFKYSGLWSAVRYWWRRRK